MEKKTNTILNNLKDSYTLVDYRNNKYMLTTPLFHRINGEPYSIFLIFNDKKITITDEGQTVARLIETVGLTEEYIVHKLSSIAKKYGCTISQENAIEIVSDEEHFNSYLNMYIHTIVSIDYALEI